MFKVTIKGPGLNANLLDLDHATVFNMIRLAMETKYPDTPVNVVTSSNPEPEPQQEPATGDGEPP